MNRREVLGALTGIAAACGLAGAEAKALPPETSEAAPPFYVLTHPGRLSESARYNLRRSWENTFKGAGRDAPIVIVLDEGMKLEAARELKIGERREWYPGPIHPSPASLTFDLE